MKKFAVVFLTLLSFLACSAPALAAQEADAPHYDLLTDLPEQREQFASETPAPNVQAEPAEPVDASSDAPVDESAYREETPGVYVPPVRLPGRGTADDLLQYWEENGWPDDVSFAFQAGGEVIDGQVFGWWEVGLVGNDPVRQQEILDLAAPSCLIEFRNALFSHGEKLAAYETVTELARSDENILQVIFVRNSDDVVVAVPEELTKEYAHYLIRELGLGAVVSVTDPGSVAAVDLTETGVWTGDVPGGSMDAARPGGAAEQQNRPVPVLWVCAAVAVLTALVLTLWALRQKSLTGAVTAEGALRAAAPLSRRQVEALVAGSLYSPGDGVRRAVFAAAGENSKGKDERI